MIRSRNLIEPLERRTFLTVLAPGFAEETFASGLSRPTAMQFAPDGRLFVAEQDGKLRLIKGGSLRSTPVVTVTTDASVERGLIGIVLDPSFSTNKQFYIYYTATEPTTHNRISRYTLNGDVADPDSRVDILDLPTLSGAPNHNGGAMAFGPDGKLYVAVGENANPPQAQDLTNPFGKILRINKDGSIPTSNPFYNTQTGIARGIWAYGLRNTFTFAFQAGTGRFFGNDVGQSDWEEVNEIKTGANYGWPLYEGDEGAAGFERPIVTFGHDGPTAIVGGAFYDPDDDHDNPFPTSYDDSYFYAEAIQGHITAVDLSGGDDDLDLDLFADDVPYPVDIDVGPDGSLYVLSRVSGYSVAQGPARVIRYRFTGSSKPSIGLNPQGQTVPVGEPVTFHVDASGAGLSYQWQRNSVNIPGATDDSYSIDSAPLADNGAKFRVVVTNSAGSVTSSSATLTVVDNQPPVPGIATPADGLKFIAGQAISFTGSATDPEDGAISSATLTWNISYFTGGLDRPFLPDTVEPGGTFTPATVTPYLLTDVFYRIRLTATDAEGLSATTSVDVLPTTTTLTLTSNVPGLTLSLDGVPEIAPHAIDAVAGLDRPLSAAASQVLDGVTYHFVGWSDGGAATHTISTPVVPTTYTATYQASVEAPPTPPDPPVVDPPVVNPPVNQPPVNVPPTPSLGFDLAPMVQKHSTKPMVAGSRGSARVWINNRGTVMFVGPVELKLFLSTDAVLDANDVPASTFNKTLRIRAGGHASAGVRFLNPQIDADGDFMLLARVKPLNIIGTDDDATNDVAVGHDVFRVERAVIDLAPNGAAPLPNPQASPVAGIVSLTANVRNAGNVNAGGLLSYSVFVRREGAPESEQVLLSTGAKNLHIRSGGHARVSARFQIPTNLTPGSYVLTVAIDTSGAFTEVDETNNTLTAIVPLVVL